MPPGFDTHLASDIVDHNGQRRRAYQMRDGRGISYASACFVDGHLDAFHAATGHENEAANWLADVLREIRNGDAE